MKTIDFDIYITVPKCTTRTRKSNVRSKDGSFSVIANPGSIEEQQKIIKLLRLAKTEGLSVQGDGSCYTRNKLRNRVSDIVITFGKSTRFDVDLIPRPSCTQKKAALDILDSYSKIKKAIVALAEEKEELLDNKRVPIERTYRELKNLVSKHKKEDKSSKTCSCSRRSQIEREVQRLFEEDYFECDDFIQIGRNIIPHNNWNEFTITL